MGTEQDLNARQAGFTNCLSTGYSENGNKEVSSKPHRSGFKKNIYIFDAKGQRTLSWFGKRKSNNVSQHVEEHLLNVQRITLGEKNVDWQQQRNTRCQSQIRTGN